MLRWPALGGLWLFFAVAATAVTARTVLALPPPPAPRNAPAEASPTPPAGAVLPFGSAIYLVLDAKISSASTPSGATIPMHLRAPLVVNGVTLAPAGTSASLRVIAARKAASGDVDGAVQIHLNPLWLPALRRNLPIRAVQDYLTPNLTAGQESTRATTDTIADIILPAHIIYQAFRPGRQLVLPPGTMLRAETGATIDATDRRSIVLAAPPQFGGSSDVPHSDLTPQPFYTAAPTQRPLPKGRATLPPMPSPTPSNRPTPTPTPTALPPEPPTVPPPPSP